MSASGIRLSSGMGIEYRMTALPGATSISFTKDLMNALDWVRSLFHKYSRISWA